MWADLKVASTVVMSDDPKVELMAARSAVCLVALTVACLASIQAVEMADKMASTQAATKVYC